MDVSEGQSAETKRFTKTFPSEVQRLILDWSLKVEGHIKPYPAYFESRDVFHETNKKPNIALLRVNRAIIKEATKILYAKNTWKVSLKSQKALNEAEYSV
jgi:hypothetical protein